MTPSAYETVFVLGGGGYLGAYEVGMLRALLEAGIKPDAVLGTSVGAINGAVLAADPTLDALARLEQLWNGMGANSIFEGSLFTRLGTALRSRTHMYSNATLRRQLEANLPVRLIEDLPVPFQCVAASIERASEHWFTSGPIADAVLASSAVPGLLPPVEIDGEHFLDGGLVNSVPVGRALALGASTVYVLHVGRLEQPLRAPQRPWEVAAVAFEIARRHRFAHDVADLPADVTVHLLPTGSSGSAGGGSWTQYMRHRDFSRTHLRIEQSYRASVDYLAKVRT
jgi:NTE family protein